MESILVIKESIQSNLDKGLVIPIAYIDSNGDYSDIKEGDFPNGGIFISKEFLTINQQFSYGEFFILTEYYETKDEEWQTNKRIQKHFSLGNKIQRLENNLLIPIVPMELPDIKTGYITHDVNLPNNQFFIEYNENVYGPFNASKQDEQWQLSPITTPSPLQLMQEHILKVSKDILINNNLVVTWEIHNEKKNYIINLRDLTSVNYEKIDWISDKKLISYFAKNGFASNFNKNKSILGKAEAQKLTHEVGEYLKKNKMKENGDRINRLNGLLKEFLDSVPFGNDIIQAFLEDSVEGKKYLDNYFMDNKELLIKNKIKEIEVITNLEKEKLNRELDEIRRTLNKERGNLDFELKNIEREKEKAKEIIEQIVKQSKEDSHKILLQKQKDLTEKIAQLEAELNLKKEEVNDFYALQNKIKNFKSLDEEISYYNRKIEELEDEKKQLEDIIKVRRKVLEQDELTGRLVEFQTLTDLLHGNKKRNPQTKLNKLKITKSQVDLNINNRSDFIYYLTKLFSEDNGRTFSFDEMCNLVICISQSFMTILAGPPGTGKTSTAIRLAQNLSLTEQDIISNTSNFLNIPVGRAWVSSRDILGFYNSLKDVYQPARTGLYDFLKLEKNTDYLKLVLLDEANLSSIEHYWSDFLGMCDPEGRTRRIDLGIPSEEEGYLNISANLRFISTINNDDSTEKLSPRLIDRVPIIELPHSSMDFSPIYHKTVNFDGAVTFDSIEEAFDISVIDANFTTEQENSLNQIIEILERPIPKTASIRVSQRKINAIKRYCHVANQIEAMRTPPLDFSVNQHILPLIEGYGSGFRSRLIALEDKLKELDFNLSRITLNNIINDGDIYSESYSYF